MNRWPKFEETLAEFKGEIVAKTGAYFVGLEERPEHPERSYFVWKQTLRGRPDFASTKSREQADRIARFWIEDLAKREAVKAARANERKARREALKAKGHNVKIGDVFVWSWGYEQTNIDFYEVVEVKGWTATIRKIAERGLASEGCGPFSGRVTAERGRFIGEPEKKIIRLTNSGEPYLSKEFGWCGLWNGEPKYCSWGH